jgi:twitching motility two-component system response regulator PilG
MSPLVSENHLAEKTSVSPDDMTLLREAAAFHKAGEKEKARELLQQAVEINPANELVLLWQASLARTAAEAMSAIEKVLNLNPDNEKAIGWKVKLDARFPAAMTEASSRKAAEVVEEPTSETNAVAESEESEAAEAEIVAEESTATDTEAWIDEESNGETVTGDLQAEVEEDSTIAEVEEASTENSADSDLADLEQEVAAVEESIESTKEDDYSETSADETATEELAELTTADSDSEEDFWSHVGSDEPTDEVTADLSSDEESYDTTARALEALDQHVSEPIATEEDDDPIRRLLEERDGDSEESYDNEPESTDSWSTAEVATESYDSEELDDTSGEASLLAMFNRDESTTETTSDAEASDETETESQLEVETIVNTHWECPLCGQQSHRVEPSCPSCKSIVDLTRVPDMALNEEVDRVSLKRLVSEWEDQVEIDPDPVVYTKLALAYLNLRQSNAALPHLLSAARMDRGNGALAVALEEVSRRPLILVVDDSRTVQRMVLSTLERELFRVQIAEDGLQALAKLNDETPSLILLDITMPRMDGYQVCKVITGNDAFKHIPVVMLSGKDGFFDKMKGRMVGAKDYITKPFEGDSLVKTVRKRIDARVR